VIVTLMLFTWFGSMYRGGSGSWWDSQADLFEVSVGSIKLSDLRLSLTWPTVPDLAGAVLSVSVGLVGFETIVAWVSLAYIHTHSWGSRYASTGPSQGWLSVASEGTWLGYTWVSIQGYSGSSIQATEATDPPAQGVISSVILPVAQVQIFLLELLVLGLQKMPALRATALALPSPESHFSLLVAGTSVHN
jgi:hypothetical protein